MLAQDFGTAYCHFSQAPRPGESESADFAFTPDELATFTAEITAIPVTGERYPTPQTE